MSSLRVFVDFATPPDVLTLLREGTAGHELVFPKKPVTSVLAKAEPDPQFGSVDVAFGQPDLQSIHETQRLRWIHVSSSGITRYDTPEFRAQMESRGILVTNSATVYQEACAEHALSFMVAQSRNLGLALRTRTANGTDTWHALRASCVPLRGQTVLILGYGAIASRLTELLRPFEVKILAFRRHPRGDEGVPVIDASQLNTALASADHIVNILPDSPQTRRFFDTDRFAAAKKGAIFYNIGRGVTVDQDALVGALRSGRLGAAWLDVTEPEPLPDNHPLWAESRCYVTPHTAGGHANETLTLVRHFLDNFKRYVDGKPLRDRVM